MGMGMDTGMDMNTDMDTDMDTDLLRRTAASKERLECIGSGLHVWPGGSGGVR